MNEKEITILNIIKQTGMVAELCLSKGDCLPTLEGIRKSITKLSDLVGYTIKQKDPLTQEESQRVLSNHPHIYLCSINSILFLSEEYKMSWDRLDVAYDNVLCLEHLLTNKP